MVLAVAVVVEVPLAPKYPLPLNTDQPPNVYPVFGVAVISPPLTTPIAVHVVGVTEPPDEGVLVVVTSKVFSVHLAYRVVGPEPSLGQFLALVIEEV